MTSKKPLIGVTGPAGKGHAAWYFTRFVLCLSGARACRITTANPNPPEALDGLLIGGGDDIGPGLYEELDSVTIAIDPERDELELHQLQLAREQDIPILGVCRGSQLLNVSLGGSLHQDIGTMIKRAKPLRTVLPRKTITIKTGTKLHSIFQKAKCRVNSLHNQAVNKLGDNVVVAARDTDGIIQAIEVTNHRFQIGVQWHPEYMPQIRRHRRLFRAFVDSAIAYRSDTPNLS